MVLLMVVVALAGGCTTTMYRVSHVTGGEVADDSCQEHRQVGETCESREHVSGVAVGVGVVVGLLGLAAWGMSQMDYRPVSN